MVQDLTLPFRKPTPEEIERLLRIIEKKDEASYVELMEDPWIDWRGISKILSGPDRMWLNLLDMLHFE
jgi:hypothetical protein